MLRPARDDEREERIANEVVVDAYGPEEQAIGWYTYLDMTLRFPFRATCVAERVISPLRVGDKVQVVGIAPVEECEHEMFVMTRWNRRTFAVPLAQLSGVEVDEQTAQAIGDWRYWVDSGHEL